MIAPDQIMSMLDRCADEHFGRNVWDDPPYFGIVTESADSVLVHWITLPGFFWADRQTHEVLLAMANAASRGPSYPVAPGEEIIGMILVTEGYGIEHDPDRPMDYWSTHSIADDPAGFEVLQCMWAPVDESPMRIVVRKRDGNEPWPAPDSIGGRVADAFREIVKALVR